MSKIQLADLGPTLECLEDKSFNSSVLRSKNYSDIINVLQDAHKLDVKMAERLLNICLMDFKEDIQYTSSNLMIISLILKKTKDGKCDDHQKLLKQLENTAWAIVELSKKLLKKSLLRKMAIETLLLHPSEVLRAVVTEHMQDVIDLLDFYPNTEFQSEVIEKIVSILARVLQILPPANKLEFVKCGLKTWFNSIIPGILSTAIHEDSDLLERNIGVLELLIEVLVTIDYSESSYWQPLLNNICTPNSYPAVLKKSIETQPSCWHRLWMIFIRLLKDQITKVNKSAVSPINALLPVVEWAFKLDASCRSRAFECWNVLTDNFSTELNEALINKRLKLLIIPLKLNNAKVPETVLAKLNSWWHLIRRFESKLDKHSDTVLLPFIHFCFGKQTPKALPPGLMTNDLAKRCVEALVEIVGHVECEGCVTIPRLNRRLISTKLIVDHWVDWVHALSVAIRSSSKDCCETDMQRVRCLWKGFVLTVAELPANQIRADLFLELLKLIETFKRDKINGDLIFNILIGSLFDNDIRIKQMLTTKSGEGPVHVVMRILNSIDMNYYYKVLKPEDVIAKLKPIMTLFMDPSYTNPDEVVRLSMNGFHDTKLLLWAALAEAICESKHDLMLNTLHEFMVWPFNVPVTDESLQISESEVVWYKWFTLYSYVQPKESAKFDESIMSSMRPGSNFYLLAPIALLKQQLSLPENERLNNLKYHTTSLLNSLGKVEGFKNIKQYLPILIDTLVLLMENAIKPNNFNLMQDGVSCVTTLLKLVNEGLQMEAVTMDLNVLKHLMKPIASILQSEKCLAKVLITPLIDELCSCALKSTKYPTLNKIIVNNLKISLSIYHRGTYMFDKVTNVIERVDNYDLTQSKPIGNEDHVISTANTIVTEINIENIDSELNKEHQKDTEEPRTTVGKQTQKKTDFTTPGPKLVKLTKKKEPNIVNTVVENGEEFVVVKSHWKFNPKKLTEHQKEKLKRKREDIPALYQDLSQSQDEFKLTTWKTDSQDASTTNSSKSESNSKTNENVTNILKNIPSSDVVPKIIENIFPHSTNKDTDKQEEKPPVKKTQAQKTPCGQSPKTPRLALKDRVFRNVRNLMEKSGTQSASKNVASVVEDISLNENNLKTPCTKMKLLANAINSAPPKISTERPLRIIKKPKKFDDTEIFALKRRKRSQYSSQSDDPPENEASDKMEDFTRTNEVRGDDCITGVDENLMDSHEYQELPQEESHHVEIPTEPVTKISNNSNPLSQIDSSQKHENLDQKKVRVYRNVKNLMTKSDTQSACETVAIVFNDVSQTLNENNSKTPDPKTKLVVNAINSAPSEILTERSSREIKNPKKLEDTKIFALKKRRRFQCSSQSDDLPENETSDKIEDLTTHNEVVGYNCVPTVVENLKETHEYQELPQEKAQRVETPTVPVTEISNNSKSLLQIDSSQKYENLNQNEEKPAEIDITVEVNIENTTATYVQQFISKENDNCSQLIEEVATPKPAEKRKDDEQSTIKKKRSRIEKQLLIDMVEGHPLLQQSQSEKRASRKNPMNEPKDSVSKRRKSLIEKSNKIKAELESVGIIQKKKDSTSRKAAKTKTNGELLPKEQSQEINITESQNTLPESLSTSEDQPISEDIIESSQDSSITTISMKSTLSKKKTPLISLDKENPHTNNKCSDTQMLLDEFNNDIIVLSDSECKDDIELPENKTAVTEEKDMTEEMDTEPMGSGDVVLVNDQVQTPIVINTEDTVVGKETQELAEADTLPMEETQTSRTSDQHNNTANDTTVENSQPDNDITHVPTQHDITPTISGTAEVINDIIQESSNTGSPSRDDILRKKEFLNDTIEISPIKTLSPVIEDKTPSPEMRSDYVVIKLATPVQSNGEPFSEKCDSPEVFTEDKVSPDKRDQSPPRKEITNNNSSSPSSSLSLKKNRPQMRFNGRAAQMLELCVPNSNRSDNEEPVTRSSPVSTPARRNLRKVYNSENTENQETNENEDNENFLKFTRVLPTTDCSPSGPILKRKLAEIADEATVSPASKRKRVSFHDPPVSTTVAVQKYIEPCGIRSPSNSAFKRLEKQVRQSTLTNVKSPKRLENTFRLETVLTKAAESFSDETTASNDTEMSLDETPAVEIIKTSELNDKDPICSELLDCNDSIDNIAGELSSPTTKALLIKELEGKVETVADLAKLTELEVNRLCIKAPKVKVAKKVLTDYAAKRPKTQEISNVETPTAALVRPPQVHRISMEVQTNDVPTMSSEMQTVVVATCLVHTQTDGVATSHCSAQTNESGSKSTKEVVASCLMERPDFLNQLMTQLDEYSVTKISETLPTEATLNLLKNKMTGENTHNVLNCVLAQSQNFKGRSRGLDLKLLQDYLCDKFDSKDLILFCSQLLQKVHDKPI